MSIARVVCYFWAVQPIFGWSALATAESWPQWRGPTGQGLATARGLPVRWSETESVAWKTDIPGRGWSSPVVENGQVWMTTAIDEPASKEDAQRRQKTSGQPLTVSAFVSLRAVSVDLKTGQRLRDIEVMTQREPQPTHVQNTYATPTPVLEQGRLYCHYGTYGTGCVDTRNGKVLWTNRKLHVDHEVGPGSSPVLCQDMLIVHCDGRDLQYVAALDAGTGQLVWKVDRSGKLRDEPKSRKAYSTPLMVEVHGQPQLISPGADWLYAYDPASGRELWKVNYGVLGFSNAPRPVAGHGMIYSCTGYMKSELLAIRVDLEGGLQRPQLLWRFKKQVPNISSPLLVGNEIYFVSDNGVATCVDAHRGHSHWVQRLGGKYSASPMYGDGHIYFFDRDGVTTVIEPGKEFKQLSVNRLDGSFMASAAAVDGALLLRSDKALYRLQTN